jgi:hypothetical protein
MLQTKSKTLVGLGILCFPLAVTLGSFIDPEDGSNMFHPEMSFVFQRTMALYIKSHNSPYVILFSPMNLYRHGREFIVCGHVS